MRKSSKPNEFNTFEEYKTFYTIPQEKQTLNGRSKYYRMGVSIAKMACEKATNQIFLPKK